jgi:hypothetical protein
MEDMNRKWMGLALFSLVLVLGTAACGPTAASPETQPEARMSPSVSVLPDGTSGTPVAATDVPDATSGSGTSPVATPQSTPASGEASSPLATPQHGPVTYQQLEIPGAGIALDVPGNWPRLEPDWAWSPDGAQDARVGLDWSDLQPPMEPEAVFLPKYAQVLSSEPLDLGWATARRITLEVYARGGPPEQGEEKAPVASVQTHVLAVIAEGGVRRAYDFYAAAPTAEALAALQPVLDQMVQSAGRQ